MKNIALLCILVVLLASCLYSPYADEYITEEPSIEDVVGVYEFDTQTVNHNLDKDKIKSSRPTITIKADKTFELNQMPYFKTSANAEYNYINGISKKGKWAIDWVGSVDYGSSGIKKHWGILLDSVPEENNNAGLLGENKPNGIIFKYGDPDEGSVMIFRKDKN
ncbi:hypothetical protein [Rufibacter tibetensis]|uniref:Lipocalin-like domain-containing protein n=1 Tax=Rufibacter tibetensis TaxID=512763 RepID=A0A0P0C6S8_9BACT|nr:hypothetical protein [Rufibacter tibetensis]ALJ00719.1 hypothetical protein DC20_19225 [Rufibacter tibetensis]